MEKITDKKWFVYVKDHHEGPHSVDEIQDKVARGVIGTEGFVWTAGMEDWKPMKDVATFDRSPPSPAQTQAQIRSRVEIPIPPREALNREIKSVLKKSQQRRNLIRVAGRLLVFCITLGSGIFMVKSGYLDPLLEIPAIQTLSDSLTEGARPTLLNLSEHFSVIRRWVSPIPQMNDVTPEEFAELKLAAGARLEKVGPKYALALSQADPLSPTFYVGTNLVDGTHLSLVITGIPDTLLNQLSFSAVALVSISKKIGKTGIIRFADGRAIPRGEYRIDLKSPETPEILMTKRYFLAGKKDAVYLDRLKDFHEKLRARSLSEVNEAKQFMLTLFSQVQATQEKFKAIRKGKLDARQRASWEEFHNEWLKIEGELDQIFQKWTPEALENEYYYGVLFRLIQEAGQAVDRLHGIQQGYFNGIQDPVAFEVQFKNDTRLAGEALEKLKTKISQVEKLPPTPSGMPQRESL